MRKVITVNEENILTKRRLKLTVQQAQDTPATLLNDWLSNERMLYSYFVKGVVKAGTLDHYLVQVTTSQTDSYNTIPTAEAILRIVDSLVTDNTQYLLCYQQPPIEIAVKNFTPLVNALAARMAAQWSLEFDDMVQTCYLCMITLYNKGYYLNKGLLTTTFVNQVMCDMRELRAIKRGGDTATLSLDDVFNGSDLTVGETIEDEHQLAMLNDVADKDLLSKHKSIVIREIGERQYKSYVDSIESGTLTQADRNRIHRLRERINKYHNIKEEV